MRVQLGQLFLCYVYVPRLIQNIVNRLLVPHFLVYPVRIPQWLGISGPFGRLPSVVRGTHGVLAFSDESATRLVMVASIPDTASIPVVPSLPGRPSRQIGVFIESDCRTVVKQDSVVRFPVVRTVLERLADNHIIRYFRRVYPVSAKERARELPQPSVPTYLYSTMFLRHFRKDWWGKIFVNHKIFFFAFLKIGHHVRHFLHILLIASVVDWLLLPWPWFHVFFFVYSGQYIIEFVEVRVVFSSPDFHSGPVYAEYCV